jgi:TonB family protein
MLADVARQSYANAKAAYEKKDWVSARDGFARAVGALDELNSSDAGLADLKTVATGFRDLAAAAIQAEAAAAAKLTLTPMMTPLPTPRPTPASSPTPSPSPVPAASPVPTPAPPPPSTPSALAVYSDADKDVAKPMVLTRTLPTWRPTPVELKLTFTGTLELLISEEGKVLSASLQKSVHPRYDATLLEAAQTWTFQPATRNGAPVRYRYVMSINLTGPIK